MSPRLEIQLEQERFVPGETVTGTVLILEGGRSRALEITLSFRESTEQGDHTSVSLAGGNLHRGDLATGASYTFAVELPRDALPNYKSKHGELYWELDAHSDEFGIDTHERRRIDVSSRRDT
jgi:hypothetical protein